MSVSNEGALARVVSSKEQVEMEITNEILDNPSLCKACETMTDKEWTKYITTRVLERTAFVSTSCADKK